MLDGLGIRIAVSLVPTIFDHKINDFGITKIMFFLKGMLEKQVSLSALTIKADMGMGGDITNGGHIMDGGETTIGGRIFIGEARS